MIVATPAPSTATPAPHRTTTAAPSRRTRRSPASRGAAMQDMKIVKLAAPARDADGEQHGRDQAEVQPGVHPGVRSPR